MSAACGGGVPAAADARPELRLAALPARAPVAVVSAIERRDTRGRSIESRDTERREADPSTTRTTAASRPRRAPAPVRVPRVPVVATVAAVAASPAAVPVVAVAALPVALPAASIRAAVLDLSVAGHTSDGTPGATPEPERDTPSGVPGVALPQPGTGVAPESCIVVPGRTGGGLSAIVRETVGRGGQERDPRAGPGPRWGRRRPF